MLEVGFGVAVFWYAGIFSGGCLACAVTACFTNVTFHRGGSRTAATSKMEHFVIIVNGWKPLTIVTKRSIPDVAAVLDPPLLSCGNYCI